MKTEIFIALSFLLIGLIVGAITTGLFIHRYFTSDYDLEEEITDEFKGEAIAFPLENLKDVIQDKLKIKFSGKPIYSDKETYKSALKEKLHETVNSEKEDWDKATYLRDMSENLDKWFDTRKSWFLSSIGKKLKPNKMQCDCEACQNLISNGVLVKNEDMAMQMFSDENKHKINDDGFLFSLV